jgi:hypothetical protein
MPHIRITDDRADPGKPIRITCSCTGCLLSLISLIGVLWILFHLTEITQFITG